HFQNLSEHPLPLKNPPYFKPKLHFPPFQASPSSKMGSNNESSTSSSSPKRNFWVMFGEFVEILARRES
ncbi:hypothetical protein LINPERPRIM_LOCUS33777, partial [Linum perenne]